MKQERKAEIITSLKMCVDFEKEDINKYFKDLQQIGKTLDYEISEFSSIFISLGNETRLKIVKALSIKDYCVCELETILDKPQPSISHHLKTLEKSGLIRGIKKGYFTHYELVKERLQSLIASFNDTL
ncbi:MAG: ArsR/SmtB family transcription factor [Candidatus Thorarchaeota archaeon]